MNRYERIECSAVRKLYYVDDEDHQYYYCYLWETMRMRIRMRIVQYGSWRVWQTNYFYRDWYFHETPIIRITRIKSMDSYPSQSTALTIPTTILRIRIMIDDTTTIWTLFYITIVHHRLDNGNRTKRSEVSQCSLSFSI